MFARRKFWIGVCALATVTAVGACSSSTKKAATTPTSAAGSAATTGSTPTTSPTSAAATGAPIKVGLICSCSGSFGASLVPPEEAYKAWVDTANKSGGIDGHPIDLTTKDDGGTPAVSVSDIQGFISDHVDAIVDLSLLDEAWASAVKSANIPVVGADDTSTPYYTNPDFYPEGETNDSVNYTKVATAKAAGATNLAYLYCAESPTCAESVPQFQADGASLGLPLVYKGEIAATAPNYTAQCVAAEQAHVTGLYIGDGATVIARVGQGCLQQGYHPIYIIDGEAFGPTLLTAPGIDANLWAGFGSLPYFATTSAVTAMNTALDQYYPGLRTSTNWSELGAESWSSGILLADAVKAGGLTASGTPSAGEIVTGLESLKGDTLDGWAPPLTFAAGQDHHVNCWFTAKIANGVGTVANNGQVTCHSGG